MDYSKLQEFILKASRATYASGDPSIKEKESDGSTTLRFSDGEFSYHDNYFGGEPYGGREVVFQNGKPIWMMVYYGYVVEHTDTKIIYPFLMKSLSTATLDMPYRGPNLFEESDLRYVNSLSGDIEKFSGVEKIYQGEDCVYEASYMGGLVDQ